MTTVFSTPMKDGIASGFLCAASDVLRPTDGVCKSGRRKFALQAAASTRRRLDRALNALKCTTSAMVFPFRRFDGDLEISECYHRPAHGSVPSTQHLQASCRSRPAYNRHRVREDRRPGSLSISHSIEVVPLLDSNSHDPALAAAGDDKSVGFVASESTTDPTEPKTRTSPPWFLRRPATVP